MGIFSGYTLAELDAGEYAINEPGRTVNKKGRISYWARIRGRLDFAICGRYDRTQPTGEGALVSSANQRVELFSDRYTLDDFQPLLFEATVELGGLVTLTGFPMKGTV